MLDDDNSSPEVIIEEPPELRETKECVDLTLDSDDNQAMEDDEQNDNEEPKGDSKFQYSSVKRNCTITVQLGSELQTSPVFEWSKVVQSLKCPLT